MNTTCNGSDRLTDLFVDAGPGTATAGTFFFTSAFLRSGVQARGGCSFLGGSERLHAFTCVHLRKTTTSTFTVSPAE